MVLVLLEIVIFLAIIAFIERRNKFRQRLTLSNLLEVELNRTSPSNFLSVSIFLISIMFLSFGYLRGKGAAEKESNFFLIAENPNIVVIRKYGEDLICLNYDPKSGFGRNISLYKVDGAKPLNLTFSSLKPIGRVQSKRLFFWLHLNRFN